MADYLPQLFGCVYPISTSYLAVTDIVMQDIIGLVERIHDMQSPCTIMYVGSQFTCH